MKRHVAITVAMLLSSAMVFVVVCAGADMNVNSNSSTSHARPLKGTWSGTTYIVGFCTEPVGTQLFISVGKGVSTLAGASEFFSVYCVDLETGVGAGTVLVTAANGDAIYADIEIDFDFVNGTWLAFQSATGGTGRFAGATGESASSGTVALTGPTTGIWEGTIVGELSF